MIVDVSSKRISYHLEFYGKYSIIAGDSGTGKTTFYKMIAQSEIGNQAIKVSSDLPIVAIDKRAGSDILARYQDCILVIDEDCKILNDRYLPSEIKRSNNYFILITRKELQFLPVSVDNYYKFSTVGKITVNERFFKNDNHNKLSAF